MFTDARDFLWSEFQRLDLLIHREILRLRAVYELSADELRGLYISDEWVDGLLGQVARRRDDIPDIAELTSQAAARRKANWANLPDGSPWHRLVRRYGLSEFEADVLLAVIAPQIELKYATLFAYLNNNTNARWPTFDLVLRLFGARQLPVTARDNFATSLGQGNWLDGRRCLDATATLLRRGLLRTVSGSESAWPETRLAPGPPLVNYLLDLPPVLAAGLAQVNATDSGTEYPLPGGAMCQLARAVQFDRDAGQFNHEDAPALAATVLVGTPGVGRLAAVATACNHSNRNLFVLDAQYLLQPHVGLEAALHEIRLCCELYDAVLYVDCDGALSHAGEVDGQLDARHVARVIKLGSPVFFAVSEQDRWRELFDRQPHLAIRFNMLDAGARRRYWVRAAAEAGLDLPESVATSVAERFILTPRQIHQAIASVATAQRLNSEPGPIAEDVARTAARALSSHQLDGLAQNVVLRHGWDDLVLPDATMRQLREITGAIRHRHTVYEEWGLAARSQAGQGLKVLFAGPSGTGKTMTAGVIAADLGVELYAIDLSRIVSKYIGETEKNLDRIFRAAHASNAILLFDEADALFGKRAEVKEAHDRYANIEVSYLLQKMEEYDGVVILASNLRRNMDDAFARRMHYVVEFPLPAEPDRRRLWRVTMPDSLPLGGDVDLEFLARQFKLAGGDIRNVVLDAAFLAAQNGRVVDMPHLVHALARQMVKQGRPPSNTDFKQYYPLLKTTLQD